MTGCTSRTFAFVFLFLSAGLTLPGFAQLPAEIYPSAEAWTSAATPADLNMDAAKLAEAQAYAETGAAPAEGPPLGAGMIVRRGYLVHQWGLTNYRFHTFSVTKGIGAVLLGVANKEFGLTLDTKAQTIYSAFGTNPATNDPNQLDDVTLEMLATHTAGFEDRSDPAPRFEYAPGTKWLYTDGGANWLADVLTVRFNEDLMSVLNSRILGKIGITATTGGVGDLDWRVVRNTNVVPKETINGITRRDFNAGIITNVDAMARLGLLLERDGKWETEEILTAAYVDTLRKPVPSIAGLPIIDSNSQPDPDFPNVTAHFGLLWFNNADGAIPNVPTDTYWAWGLGDHLIVVIPSLDLVIARTSGQPTAQHGGALPRAWIRPEPCAGSTWCGRYEVLAPFLQPIVAAVQDAGTPPPAPGAPVVTLTPSATQVTAGGTVTLNWSAANATSCTASNGWSGAKATSGSETVTVAQTATYALACTGTGGTTQQSVTVTVASNPNPTPTPPPGGGGGGGGGGALQWWMLIALLLAGTHGTMFANRRR